MGIGSKIRKLREVRGWSQKQLATKSGLEQSHISQIERENIGKPHLDTLEGLFQSLGINFQKAVKALLDETEDDEFIQICIRDNPVFQQGAISAAEDS